MRALVGHGKEDIRCDTVTDPEIEHPRGAIVKVTSCAICGSDLHPFRNFIPAMMPGDIMGHEMMGTTARVRRNSSDRNIYRDRTGFPGGLAAARGAAKDFQVPVDMRAAPALAAVSDGRPQERAHPH